MNEELIAEVSGWLAKWPYNDGARSMLERCISALSAVGEPQAWYHSTAYSEHVSFHKQPPDNGTDWRTVPLYAHPEGDRDTGKREFCAYCGAGVGKFKREGEGTCNKCDPEGCARFHSPPAVSRDQTDAPTAQPTVLPDPETEAPYKVTPMGPLPVGLKDDPRLTAALKAAVSSDSIAPVGLGMQEESKPQTPIGKLNAAYIKEQAERKAAGGKLVDGVYHPPESAASVGSGELEAIEYFDVHRPLHPTDRRHVDALIAAAVDCRKALEEIYTLLSRCEITAAMTLIESLAAQAPKDAHE